MTLKIEQLILTLAIFWPQKRYEMTGANLRFPLLNDLGNDPDFLSSIICPDLIYYTLKQQLCKLLITEFDWLKLQF